MPIHNAGGGGGSISDAQLLERLAAIERQIPLWSNPARYKALSKGLATHASTSTLKDTFLTLAVNWPGGSLEVSSSDSKSSIVRAIKEAS